MRIAHLANFYGPRSGGLRTAIHALGAGYQSNGHRMLVVVPGEADTEEYTEFGKRVTVSSPVLPFSGGYRVIVRRKHVARLLAEFKPDVLEVSDRTTLRAFGARLRTSGVKTVFFAHERVDGVLRSFLPRFVPSFLVRRLADSHNRATAKAFDTIVCTTGFAREEFDRIGAASELVSLGVDGTRFHPSKADAHLRERLAAPEEKLMVLASRLSAEKRPDLAIDAIRLVSDAGMSVRLVCAGSGPLERHMRGRAAGAPVTFMGFITDRELFASLLATADAVIAPGPIETFGLAALEALASGTPVVVNAASALPSVVQEAGLAAHGTPQAFAAALTDVLSSDPVASRAAARARAEALPWSSTVATLLTLYQATAGHETAAARATTLHSEGDRA